ncbi:hypothetical protein BB560_005935, partial [Smittium megazygosporum]
CDSQSGAITIISSFSNIALIRAESKSKGKSTYIVPQFLPMLPVAIMSEQHDERTLDSPVTMTLRDYNELQRMATALTELQSRVDSFPLE